MYDQTKELTNYNGQTMGKSMADFLRQNPTIANQSAKSPTGMPNSAITASVLRGPNAVVPPVNGKVSPDIAPGATFPGPGAIPPISPGTPGAIPGGKIVTATTGTQPPQSTNPSTPTDSKIGSLQDMLGGVAKPGQQTLSDDERKSIKQKAEADDLAAGMLAHKPELDEMDRQLSLETTQNEKYRAQREQAMLQNLAVRGILNVSSEDNVLRQNFAADEKVRSDSIASKYGIMKLSLLGKLSDHARDAALKAESDKVAELDKKWENYYKEMEGQRDTYKTLSDEDFRNKNFDYTKEKDKIDREFTDRQNSLDRQLQEKKISQDAYNAAKNREIDWYNAETSRLKANADAKATEPSTAMQDNALTSASDLLTKFDAKEGTSAVGKSGFLGSLGYGLIPGTKRSDFVTQFENFKASADLNNVKYLKGQGAVSDAERALLSNATKLALNQSEPEFRKSLVSQIVLMGGEADVTLTDPVTGESQVIKSNKAGIDQAMKDGLTVEYGTSSKKKENNHSTAFMMN